MNPVPLLLIFDSVYQMIAVLCLLVLLAITVIGAIVGVAMLIAKVVRNYR